MKQQSTQKKRVRVQDISSLKHGDEVEIEVITPKGRRVVAHGTIDGFPWSSENASTLDRLLLETVGKKTKECDLTDRTVYRIQ